MIAAPGTRLDLRRLGRLDEALGREIDAGLLPGAVVAVWQGGSVVHETVAGYRDVAAQARMERDCLFRCASMTKPLVSVAALQLIEQGRLVISEPVATYLPSFAEMRVGLAGEPAVRPPTVHDLFRHTSGLTYGPFGSSPVEVAYLHAGVLDPQQTGEAFEAKFAALPLRFQPGTTFEYSVSTDVLGRIVEVVSGQKLGEYLAEHLTGPLGMRDTGFALDDAQNERLAQGIGGAPGTALLAQLYTHARPPSWHSGGGGILSTVPDYLRFATMLLAGGTLEGTTYLGGKTVAWMTSNHLAPDLAFGPLTGNIGISAPLPAYGYGFGLGVNVRLSEGRNASPGSIGDFGWGGVSGTIFWCDPAEDLAVVAMLAAPDQRHRTRPMLRALVYQAVR